MIYLIQNILSILINDLLPTFWKKHNSIFVEVPRIFARKSPPGSFGYRLLNQSAARRDCFGVIETGSNLTAQCLGSTVDAV